MVRTSSTSLLTRDTETEDLVLRVCGSSRDGEVVRLRSTKCAIGSGNQCTLRLRARGVAPVHCLIVRGSRSTVVRRWALDTRLNGHAFADAELAVGDRLSVGRIEFEVVQLGRSALADPPSEPSGAGQVDTEPLPETVVSSPAAPYSQDAAPAAEELEAKRQEIEEQIEQLHRETAQWQSEKSETEKHLSEQNAAVEARCAELEDRFRAFEEQTERWQWERTDTERRLNERQEELDFQIAELETQKSELDAIKSELDARKVELAARQEDLRQQQAEWETRQTERDVEEGSQSAPAASQEPADAPVELGPFAAPDDDSTSQSNSEPATNPWQGAQAETQTDDSPVSLGDIFADMKETSLVGEVQDNSAKSAEHEPAQVYEPNLDHISPASATGPDRQPEWTPDESDDGDESIDAYMQRLLQRVGKAPESEGTPEPPSREPEPEAPAKPRPTVMNTPAEMKPRVPAERQVDMSAMRQVANDSAQSALNAHAIRTLVVDARVKVMVTTMGATIGALFTWAWWSGKAGNLALSFATVSFMVALIWGFRYVVLTGRIAAAKRSAKARRSQEAADAEPVQDVEVSANDDEPKVPEGDATPTDEQAEAPAS